MYALMNKYYIAVTQQTGKLLLQILMIVSTTTANAQNINKPNKMGPMGTQVNTYTGNLFISRNDIYIPARGFDLNISFNYNSFNYEQNNGFGNGWSSGYSIRYINDTAGSKTIVWGDGREDNYTLLSGSTFRSPKGFFSVFSQYQPNKYLLTEPDGTKFYFDNSTHKRVTRKEDPNGNYINFNYTDTLLTSLINTAGQTISFTYNSNGDLATVVDAIAAPARTYTYTYESNGNLKQVTDPMGGTNKYSYLINGPMKTMTDKNNNTVDIIYFSDFSISEIIGCNKRISFSYDTSTNITIVTDHLASGNNQVTKYGYKKSGSQVWLSSISGNCCGFNMSFEYDDNGNKIKETDANGNVYNYTYDSSGNMLTMKDPLSRISTFTYSATYNQVTSFTDPKGHVYIMIYDAAGNLTQLTEPGNNIYTAAYNANGDIISSTDPKGNVYAYSYDAYGNPVSVSGPNGYHASLANDARGNLLAFTDARNNTHTAEYDILNRLKKIIDPVNNSVKLNYDAEGNVISLINKNNETSLLGYDASNRIVQLTDVMGKKTYAVYDGMNNLTGIINALGHSVKFSYDTRNRLTGITDPQGNNSSLNYDANGNITSISLPDGETINYTYDPLNRLTSMHDINGAIANFSYDRNNNITRYTNGAGADITAEYDSLDRLKKITDPLGNSYLLLYDRNSNITSVTDRNGFTSNYTYDSLDRVKTMTDNNGFTVTRTYDAAGNIISLKDQNNNITSYVYDNLNRVNRVTYPDSRYMEYTYNNKGNIIVKRLTDGTSINFTYDSLNRVISKTLPDGHVYSYTYDGLGRVLSAANNTGTVTIAYDALNRVVSETYNGRTVNYAYNIAGRTQTTIYPDSTAVTKNFDTRNRLLSLSRNNTILVSYQYNNLNKVIAKTFSNGITTNMQYDFAGRLSNFSTAGGTVQNTNLSYNNEQNKTAIERLNNPAKSEQFTYDNGRRLTNYKRGVIGGAPTLQNTYAYDALGNRTAANLNGVNTLYTGNNLNQLTSSNNGSQNINFTYDNNGNLTYDGFFYKTYDAEKRLLKDSSSPANVLTYQYDAFNRRVQKNMNGNILNYTYSGMKQIEERDNATNIILNKTIFSNFLTPLANEKNNTTFYYHQNEINSVEAITNQQGRLLEKYEYDAYGKMSIYDSLNNLLPGSLTGNRFGFTGQVYDSATGNYKFFFREYNPSTGLFNQRDLIGYADGMGMYQYVHDNPANGIDIFGLNDCPDEEKETSTRDKIETAESWLNGISGWVEKAVGLPMSDLMGREKYLEELADFYWKTGNLKAEKAVVKELKQVVNGIDALKDGKLAKTGSGLGKLGFGLNVADAAIKGNKFGEAINDYNSGKIDGYQLTKSGANLAQSGLGFTPAGGIYNLFDFAQEKATSALTGGNGQSMNDNAEYAGKFYGDPFWSWWDSQDSKVIPEERSESGMSWQRNQRFMRIRKRLENKVFTNPRPKPNCPQNGGPGGTLKNNPKSPGTTKPVIAVGPKDPNAIIGPDGKPDKHWVSIKDRLAYTVLYENDSTASAPAKFVRITSPIEPKQDAATFQLGNFGFNNQTFSVPPSLASYYQRLDCRDSLGLYVDITAGYDQINHVAFWEFQSIDPITLLPPTDPLKGFLLLQDSTQPFYGHGFVNFSIKPIQTAITLDTIGARAAIVFDLNDTIATNIHTNTIDAFAPTSHMNALPANSSNPIHLSWTGADDTGGCGIDYYTIYVSTDQVNFSVLIPKISSTDTIISLPPDSNYCFFVLATDRVGNKETLRPGEIKCSYVGPPLPVTWLYFRGKTVAKDNILDWATANEQNAKRFDVERSLNGTSFSKIGDVNAHGNSNQANTYQYTDHNINRLGSEVMFYRLKQIDIDGNYKYSNIVRLRYSEKNTANSIIYPNPTQGSATVLVGDNSLVGTIAILYDMNGRLLESIKISANSQPVNLTKYVNGIYFIKLSNNEVLKIVKQ
ncbi:MAG TPA: RHS repeat-associated core domain-containing protein [Ferruginibacter sp.]|nr:RHS repeat-associated core domain-containing protein [Ferruginibacter sp.]